MPTPTTSYHRDWREISNSEGYQLSMAEFKGATLQALKDLDSRVSKIESYNTSTRLISMVISGISGVFAGIFGARVSR